MRHGGVRRRHFPSFKDFKPDAVFGMHVRSAFPVGTVALMPGGEMASSDTFRIVVHGKGSHGTLHYGSRKTTLKDLRKEISTALLHAMLGQLGLSRRDLDD